MIDNASEDGTAALLQERFGPRARIIVNACNLGYAGGYNSALPMARGEFVLLLNPDARLAADFLERALPAFDDPRVGLVSGLLVRPDGDTVDSSGQFLARSRRPIDRGFDETLDPQRDAPGPVLGVCGAAALYRAAMIEDISEPGSPDEALELFDPDFFAFFEDLEVAWRAWRAGWLAVHVPEARAVHMRGSGDERPLFGMMFKHTTPVLTHIVKSAGKKTNKALAKSISEINNGIEVHCELDEVKTGSAAFYISLKSSKWYKGREDMFIPPEEQPANVTSRRQMFG